MKAAEKAKLLQWSEFPYGIIPITWKLENLTRKSDDSLQKYINYAFFFPQEDC